MIPSRFPWGNIVFLVILATATGWSVGSEYIWAATLFGFSAGMQLARLLEDLFYYRVKRKAEQLPRGGSVLRLARLKRKAEQR